MTELEPKINAKETIMMIDGDLNNIFEYLIGLNEGGLEHAGMVARTVESVRNNLGHIYEDVRVSQLFKDKKV